MLISNHLATSYRARYLYFGEFELKVRKRAPLWQAGGGHGTPRLGRPGLRHCEPTLSSRLRSPEREGEVGPNEREPASEKLAVLSSNFDQGLAVCQKKAGFVEFKFGPTSG